MQDPITAAIKLVKPKKAKKPSRRTTISGGIKTGPDYMLYRSRADRHAPLDVVALRKRRAKNKRARKQRVFNARRKRRG